MKRTIALLAIPILLGACDPDGVQATDPCGPWRPIRISKDDTLTGNTARQVLAHNETGARLCHWEPSR